MNQNSSSETSLKSLFQISLASSPNLASEFSNLYLVIRLCMWDLNFLLESIIFIFISCSTWFFWGWIDSRKTSRSKKTLILFYYRHLSGKVKVRKLECTCAVDTYSTKSKLPIVNNYPQKWRWIAVDIYRAANLNLADE